MEGLKSLVAERLQDRRGDRSQKVFARQVESSQQTISKYERGDIPQSWTFLARLRQLEGLDLNELFDCEGNGR